MSHVGLNASLDGATHGACHVYPGGWTSIERGTVLTLFWSHGGRDGAGACASGGMDPGLDPDGCLHERDACGPQVDSPRQTIVNFAGAKRTTESGCFDRRTSRCKTGRSHREQTALNSTGVNAQSGESIFLLDENPIWTPWACRRDTGGGFPQEFQTSIRPHPISGR
jgi:hypothetical protein